MAGYGFNKVILIGNLTADPELKMTQTGIPVTSFSIAVGRRYAKETDDCFGCRRCDSLKDSKSERLQAGYCRSRPKLYGADAKD